MARHGHLASWLDMVVSLMKPKRVPRAGASRWPASALTTVQVCYIRALTTGLSMRARAVTAIEPRMVPLIVCGRRNFQKACWNATRRCIGEISTPAGWPAPAPPSAVADAAEAIVQAFRWRCLAGQACLL